MAPPGASEGPPPDVELRHVGTDDGESLAELRVSAMRQSLEALGRFDAERARTRFLGSFDPALTREILFEGRRVGFVVVRPADGGWLLDHLYVRPAEQRRGIGSAVVQVVVAEARAARANLRLGALKQSASNAFYLRHGFELVQESEWDNHYVLRHRAA